MGWYDALDAQSELVRWTESNEGIHATLAFGQSLHAKNGVELDTRAAALPMIEAAKLRWAEPIYVNDEVMDLIELARDGRDGRGAFKPEPLIEPDLLTPNGFVLFPRALYMKDINGKLVAFRAMSWAVTVDHNGQYAKLRTPGVSPEREPGLSMHLSLYSHWDDEDDYTRERGERLPVKWALMHVTPWHFNRDFDGAVYQEGQDHGLYGTLDERQASANMEGNRLVWGTFQVLHRLAKQSILVAPKERPPRPYWRRARKLDLPERVTVMHLRKGLLEPSYGEGDGEARYSHRFMVSPHWRWQWYPSEKVHRQKWIAPYIKGPPDAPLVLKDRVFSFVR